MIKPCALMPEAVELDVFSRLAKGESPSAISMNVGCSKRVVEILRQLGRPRFRYSAHGQLWPSTAVIAWHCAQFQEGWTVDQEIERRVIKPMVYDTPVVSTRCLQSPGRRPDVRREGRSV